MIICSPSGVASTWVRRWTHDAGGEVEWSPVCAAGLHRSSPGRTLVEAADVALLASTCWLRFFVFTFLDLAAYDFAVERKSLKHDVEAGAVLVRKHKSEVEPVVVLALALDDRVGAMRGLTRFFFRHWNSPW